MLPLVLWNFNVGLWINPSWKHLEMRACIAARFLLVAAGSEPRITEIRGFSWISLSWVHICFQSPGSFLCTSGQCPLEEKMGGFRPSKLMRTRDLQLVHKIPVRRWLLNGIEVRLIILIVKGWVDWECDGKMGIRNKNGNKKIKLDQWLFSFFQWRKPHFWFVPIRNILVILLGQSHDVLEKEPLNVFAQSRESVSVKEGILRAAVILEMNQPKDQCYRNENLRLTKVYVI